ncbi:acyltransferase family protein [Flavivirga rizhaonensis]|uniref:Acyltransferase n=1 Tax=Flavivirga rizhaonensis TaxID=2559571 RepID=A0A4S1E393_9FLAO|nr:acyltransferase [Flavivirga rizhaonensis]TGV04422.1 acyltransferase [Flavivirga rizhaonensis]
MKIHKQNNFDFLRFMFALFVVISHAYPLSGSSEEAQWIYKITNGQIVLASIGLNGFFVISGFFIFQSLQRSKTLKSYFKKRFLRLFPGLFILLILSILMVPFLYQGSIPLLSNKQFYTYLPNNLNLYNFQSGIKGVFDSNNYHAINGSLWTLRYEFSLYIALAFLFYLKGRLSLVKGLLLISFFMFFILFNFCLDRFSGASVFGMQGYHILNFSAFFMGGSFLASVGFDAIKKESSLFFVVAIAVSLIILLASIYFNFYSNIKHLMFTLLILLIGYMNIPILQSFGKIGDMSYGIYIYSFFIQQIFMVVFKFDLYELMIYSVIASIILGYLSWHLVEKKALFYKNKPILSLKRFTFKT